MLSPEIKKNAVSVGILLLPLMLVKVAGVIFGGPAGAQAESVAPVAGTDTQAPAPAAAAVTLTKQQLAASNYILSLRDQPFGQSPLLYHEVKETPVVEVPEVIETPDGIPIPKFILNAIISRADSSKALINNRPYVEGDTIRGTEWLLTTIDAPGRAVILTDPSTGQSITVRVDVR